MGRPSPAVEKQHKIFLGDVNVANCPGRFLAVVRQLVRLGTALGDLPWVVNTMGWCRGLGLLLLTDTVRLVQPTTLVQITSRFHRYCSNDNDGVYGNDPNDIMMLMILMT